MIVFFQVLLVETVFFMGSKVIASYGKSSFFSCKCRNSRKLCYIIAIPCCVLRTRRQPCTWCVLSTRRAAVDKQNYEKTTAIYKEI